MKSFSDYNPIAVFIYYFCVLIPIMFFQNPVLGAMGILSGFLYYLVRNGLQGFGKSCWILLIPILAMIINPLFIHNGKTVLFILNNNPVTLEALLFGLSSGLMIGGTLIWFASFNQIMTSDKLLYIFGSVSPKLALILSMALRYIPLFRQQIVKTNNAQKAMGLYKEDNAIDKIRGGMRIFSVMVTWALENGVITADSMTARGYGTGKRSRFAIFKWCVQDYTLLAVSLCLSAVTCISGISGHLRYIWYPEIIPAGETVFTLIGYLSFAVLSMIPDYLQIKEETRWRSLRSKI